MHQHRFELFPFLCVSSLSFALIAEFVLVRIHGANQSLFCASSFVLFGVATFITSYSNDNQISASTRRILKGFYVAHFCVTPGLKCPLCFISFPWNTHARLSVIFFSIVLAMEDFSLGGGVFDVLICHFYHVLLFWRPTAASLLWSAATTIREDCCLDVPFRKCASFLCFPASVWCRIFLWNGNNNNNRKDLIYINIIVPLNAAQITTKNTIGRSLSLVVACISCPSVVRTRGRVANTRKTTTAHAVSFSSKNNKAGEVRQTFIRFIQFETFWKHSLTFRHRKKTKPHAHWKGKHDNNKSVKHYSYPYNTHFRNIGTLTCINETTNKQNNG